MRNLKVVLPLVLVIVACSALGFSFQHVLCQGARAVRSQGLRGGTGPIEVVLECEVPKLPSEAPRLEVIPDPLPLEVWISLAEDVFNMTDIEVKYVELHRGTEIWLVGKHHGNPSVLQVGHGGYFIWSYSAEGHAYKEAAPPEEVKHIADALFSRVVDYGVAPSNLEFKFIGVYDSHISKGPWGAVITERTAVYRIIYGDYRFCRGVEVCIGADGVSAMFVPWRFVRENGTVRIQVSLEEAMRRLADKPISSDVVKIIIHDVELGYANFFGEHEFLPPAYIFDVTLVFEDGGTKETVLWVLAT